IRERSRWERQVTTGIAGDDLRDPKLDHPAIHPPKACHRIYAHEKCRCAEVGVVGDVGANLDSIGMEAHHPALAAVREVEILAVVEAADRAHNIRGAVPEKELPGRADIDTPVVGPAEDALVLPGVAGDVDPSLDGVVAGPEGKAIRT